MNEKEDSELSEVIRRSQLQLREREAAEAERDARFNRRFRLLELKERREDRALRRSELTAASGSGIRFTSAQATVAAALLAVISAVIGGLIQAGTTRDIEVLRANAADKLAKNKFETTLILKAIEAPSRETQIRNLKFFLKAGFISDTDGKIAAIDEKDYPSLARSSPAEDGNRTTWLGLLKNRVPCEPKEDTVLNLSKDSDRGERADKVLSIAIQEMREGITEFCAPERVIAYFAGAAPLFDPTPTSDWAAAFVGWVMAQAGNPGNLESLGPTVRDIWWSARDKGLTRDDFAKLAVGDIVVWVRQRFGSGDTLSLIESVNTQRELAWGGHIGFVVGISDGSISVIGGNQLNAVNVGSFPLNPAPRYGALIPLGYFRL